jgi:hypothetical protein
MPARNSCAAATPAALGREIAKGTVCKTARAPIREHRSAASVERRARKNRLIAWVGTRQSRPLRRRVAHALLPLRRCLTSGFCLRGASIAGAHGSVIPDKRIGAKGRCCCLPDCALVCSGLRHMHPMQKSRRPRPFAGGSAARGGPSPDGRPPPRIGRIATAGQNIRAQRAICVADIKQRSANVPHNR